ncbi:alpha/beta hydrolase [Luteimonas sp. FCS-9]|uniref:alpha/beta hydrolase n=1 Tax=Luteimonas sp. FCS-9 TaxID=1547516 RepID=UPI0012E0B434|nr:alpha/beta hydrolase [Luteimonas sp. FCS-9]
MSRPLRRLAAVMCCLVLAGCAFRVQESHLVRPMPAPPTDLAALRAATPAYTATEARIPTPDGASLYQLRLQRPDARATVLYFGGNGYRIGLHAGHSLRAYDALPVDLVLVDHRGYGGSTGTPTIAALQADALQVYDALRAETAAAGRALIVHGQSLGSFLAGHVADARTLDGLVLESSMTTTEDWAAAMRARSGFWTRLAVRRFDIAPALQQAGNLEIARRLDEPVLFVVGERDVVTAPRFTQALYDAAPLPASDRRLLVVPGRGHNDASVSPQFHEALLALLDRIERG